MRHRGGQSKYAQDQRALRHQRTEEEGIALLKGLLEENTKLTEQVHRLTQEIHHKVAS